MAWASKKLYAILMSSEEGKDILEGIGEKSQDEFDKEVDAFLGNGGKGTSQNADYKKAKEDDNAREDEEEKVTRFDRFDIMDSLDGLDEDASDDDYFYILGSFELNANQKEKLIDAYKENKLDKKTFDSIVNPDKKSIAKPDKKSIVKPDKVKQTKKSNVKDEIVNEAIKYYKENSFGYDDLRDYVETDFAHYNKEDREEIYNRMKKQIM